MATTKSSLARNLVKAIRFHESTARAVGRTAMGVKGVTLEGPDDEVIGMVCVRGLDSEILVVSENGLR